MAFLKRVALLTGVACISVVAFGQGETPPVVKLRFDRPIVSAGKPFKAFLTVTFAPGLHAYQNPPSAPSFIPIVVKAADKSISLLSVEYPKGAPSKVAGESKPVNVYQGTIKIPMTFKAPSKTGSFPVKITFSYQQCDERSCYPPTTVNAKANVIIASKDGKSLPPPGKAPKIGG